MKEFFLQIADAKPHRTIGLGMLRHFKCAPDRSGML